MLLASGFSREEDMQTKYKATVDTIPPFKTQKNKKTSKHEAQWYNESLNH